MSVDGRRRKWIDKWKRRNNMRKTRDGVRRTGDLIKCELYTATRFWLDFGRRLARLPDRPSARPACTRAPRKPPCRPLSLRRRQQTVCARRLSTLAACRPCDVCRQTLARLHQPRPVASATVLLLYIHADGDGGAGGAEMGRSEEPTGNELRQAEPVTSLLLRERHHAEGRRRTLRLPVRLRSGRSLHHGLSGQPDPGPKVRSGESRNQVGWCGRHGAGSAPVRRSHVASGSRPVSGQVLPERGQLPQLHAGGLLRRLPRRRGVDA